MTARLTQQQHAILSSIMTWLPPYMIISCDDCFQEMETFAEEQLAGHNPSEVMPLIRQHLESCPDCREDFEALLQSLEANSGELPG